MNEGVFIGIAFLGLTLYLLGVTNKRFLESTIRFRAEGHYEVTKFDPYRARAKEAGSIAASRGGRWRVLSLFALYAGLSMVFIYGGLPISAVLCHGLAGTVTLVLTSGLGARADQRVANALPRNQPDKSPSADEPSGLDLWSDRTKGGKRSIWLVVVQLILIITWLTPLGASFLGPSKRIQRIDVIPSVGL